MACDPTETSLSSSESRSCVPAEVGVPVLRRVLLVPHFLYSLDFSLFLASPSYSFYSLSTVEVPAHGGEAGRGHPTAVGCAVCPEALSQTSDLTVGFGSRVSVRGVVPTCALSASIRQSACKILMAVAFAEYCPTCQEPRAPFSRPVPCGPLER